MNCTWRVEGCSSPGTLPEIQWAKCWKPVPPASLNYYCPYCADIWARCTLEGETGYQRIEKRPCREHGNGLLNLSSYSQSYMHSLPNELLKREYLILTELNAQATNESAFIISDAYRTYL